MEILVKTMSTAKKMKDRTQVYNPVVGRFIKKDITTGRFMKQKKDGTAFKRVETSKITKANKSTKPKTKPKTKTKAKK